MAGSKLKLPASLRGGTGKVSEALQIEKHRTQRAAMDAYAKVESARLEIARQMLEIVKKGLDVVQSYQQLQTTRAEWQGRIQVAEVELQKAHADLAIAREKNASVKEALELTAQVQQRLLKFFDNLMDAAQDPALSREAKQQLTSELLQLSDKLVALRK